MLQELEKAIQKDLDKGFPGIGLKADFAKLKPNPVTPSVAEQLIGVATSIKAVQADIDQAQDLMNQRVSEVLAKIQTDLDALRDDLHNRFDAMRRSLGQRG